MPHQYPQFVTTKQLAALLAGGDDYIRTKKNEVRGLALRRDMNPDVPEAVVFGKGPRIEARAKLFLESGKAVPAYVKRKVNSWQYLGQYRATAIRDDLNTIRQYGATRKPGTVAGVLFLECIDEPQVAVAGGGYADPLTRREIETAAIAFVTRNLEGQGFIVHDHQRENRGYDLLAIRETETLFVEVKGTDADAPRFFISRNERRLARTNADWRLYVVCSARRVPVLHRYTNSEMETNFAFDELAWECVQADA